MEENKDHEAIESFMQGKSIKASSDKEARSPHEALFLVLTYLPLYELLAMSEVCLSLRDAVNNDVLQWLVVQRPLNWRLSDEILMKLASKVNGRLRTLALINCVKITDSGLHQVVQNNPLIKKLHVPGCIGLTPQGIVRAVEMLSKHNHTLESLHVNGIYSIKEEHLDTLNSYLKVNSSRQNQNLQQPLLYLEYSNTPSIVSDRCIDVEMCGRCNQVRVVFDCPKEMCMQQKSKWFQGGCRGCCVCIPRCAECGGCNEFEEQEEAACMDILCSECWFQLPKCLFCNRPYCKQHAYLQNVSSDSTGFLCEVCEEQSQDFYIIGL